MSVININQKHIDSFWQDFQALADESLALVVVGVGKDGKPTMLLPDDPTGNLAIIGALKAAEDELLAMMIFND